MTRRLVGASDAVWTEASAARVPLDELPRLASVRDREGVRTAPAGDFVWVGWDRETTGAADVTRCLMAARGVEFYVRRGSVWTMFGKRVPTSLSPPTDGWKAIDTVLVPDRIGPIAPPKEHFAQIRLGVIRGGTAQPVTALKCEIMDLTKWSQTETSAKLASLMAARRGTTAILRANVLPPIPRAGRFWGESVFLPVGWRANPDLAPDILRASVGVQRDELLFLDETGADVVPESAFSPLTRAGLRLASEGSHDSP